MNLFLFVKFYTKLSIYFINEYDNVLCIISNFGYIVSARAGVQHICACLQCSCAYMHNSVVLKKWASIVNRN